MDTEHQTTPELARPEAAIVKVRRQPGDHRLADYRFADVSRLRWDFVGGGMRQKSQWHVYGFVMCDGMVSGKVGHSCQHGPPPHKIKVCLTKKYNEKIWPLISEKVGLKPPSRHLKRNMKRKRRRDRKKLEASPVCNLYSMTKNVDSIRRLFNALNSRVGNLPSQPGIYPDYPAPVVRNADGAREIAMMRWGMPSSQRAIMDATAKRAKRLEAKGETTIDFKELMRKEPDSGVTNIRNLSSPHWKRWLGPENRCLVPFTSFAEYDTIDGKKVPVWFAADESRPLMCFAGIWTNWTSVRKAKEGEVTSDVFGFLTTTPNAELIKVHPKAMPVILTTLDEWDTWMSADWAQASKLQRPLPDGSLKIVASGEKEDLG